MQQRLLSSSVHIQVNTHDAVNMAKMVETALNHHQSTQVNTIIIKNLIALRLFYEFYCVLWMEDVKAKSKK